MKRTPRSEQPVFLKSPKTSGDHGSLVPITGRQLPPLEKQPNGPLVRAEGHPAAPPGLPSALATQHIRKVSMWPSRGAVATYKSSRVAKAPFALQLEAFIRKEHRQYLLEHPDCTCTDTLHIFRESFGVLINHFKEYKSLLDLIRDEYDASLYEMSEQVKRMTVADLENKSDRSLHAMELMQLKESLQATISNQQAQLRATQSLLHALRQQLGVAEHTNIVLKYEMERKYKEYDDAKGQVKLLSQSLIEESARTAQVMEASRRKDKEIQLLNARIKVQKENLDELEACLRNRTRGYDTETPVRTDNVAVVEAKNSVFTDEFVHQLLAKVDKLEFQLEKTRSDQPMEFNRVTPDVKTVLDSATNEEPRRVVQLNEVSYPVIREWMRLEGIGEQEIESTDYIIPPGEWTGDVMFLLKACAPVRNRHFGRRQILALVEDLWDARGRQTTYTQLQVFFTDWLSSQSGGGAALKELGCNLLYGCQRNLDHPECRALILLLQGFLPEELVTSWRRMLRHLEREAETSPSHLVGEVLKDVLLQQIRSVWPEKHRAHMLQLGFYLYRLYPDRDTVPYMSILAADSYFVTLLKQQYLREVESYTLQVVEGIRRLGAGRSAVLLSKVFQLLESLDPGMSQETICNYLAGASQQTVKDVAAKDLVTTARLDVLLPRLRRNVLLRRTTPPDD